MTRLRLAYLLTTAGLVLVSCAPQAFDAPLPATAAPPPPLSRPATATAAPSPNPTSDDVTPGSPTGGRAGVDVQLTQSLETVYYSVTGTTTDDIFDSLGANGPQVDLVRQGHFASGLTESERSYSYDSLDYGDYCELQTVEIELNLVVTLPQHADPSSLSDRQSGRWQDLADGVAVHEQAHVDIYVDGVEAFRRAVKGLPQGFSDCDSLRTALDLAWETQDALIDRRQEAFHRSEEQLSVELRGPVQEQIDENKAELSRLQQEIAAASLVGARLRAQLLDLDGAMRPYDDQMAAIRAEYPGLELPPETYDEYERLRAEWSRINGRRNEAVAQLNASVDGHNRTVGEFNRLTQETNKLIDEMAWLP